MRTEAFSVFAGSNVLKSFAISMALAAFGSASAQTSDPGWRWSIAPYVWGTDISADVTFPSGESIGGELKFEDILDDLDFAAMLHAEGHRGEWGMFVDVTYARMSDGTARELISTAADAEFGLYELAAVYTPGAEKGPFGVFAGARIVDATLDLDFTTPIGSTRRSADKSYTDFLVGARYLVSFNDRWALNLRGDIGAGDSEQDWSVSAQLGWRFGTELRNAVLVGWRHLEIELEQDGRQTEVSFDGPLVGVLFGW